MTKLLGAKRQTNIYICQFSFIYPMKNKKFITPYESLLIKVQIYVKRFFHIFLKMSIFLSKLP